LRQKSYGPNANADGHVNLINSSLRL